MPGGTAATKKICQTVFGDTKSVQGGFPVKTGIKAGSGIPNPVGSLKKPSANWLKKQGVDPHTLKEMLPGPVSHFDIYKDKAGNLVAVRKGASKDTAEWLGHIDDF